MVSPEAPPSRPHRPAMRVGNGTVWVVKKCRLVPNYVVATINKSDDTATKWVSTHRHHNKNFLLEAKMPITPKRIKSGIAVTEAHLKLCDDNLRRAKTNSRNGFVEKAIEFYAGYLNAESNPSFYEEMYSRRGEEAVKKIGDTLVRSQFRLAVELAKLANLIAATNGIPDDDLQRLSQKCVTECKELAGIWSAEDIVRFQNHYQR